MIKQYKPSLRYTLALVLTGIVTVAYAASEKYDDYRFRVGANSEIDIDAGSGIGKRVTTLTPMTSSSQIKHKLNGMVL